METIIGIDLGTTNSVVSVIQDGESRVIREADNGILPSVVGIDDAGALIVGMPARNQLVVAPDRSIASIKRKMGSELPVTLDGQTYVPQEISGIILKALKHRAERSLGRSVSKAVITVPAYFTDSQRQATKEAGEIAGLDVVRIINEPTAAALSYESGEAGNRKILVYDLGGGTFDVSIVAIENSVVEVLASTGDTHLGGDDFDRLIAAHLSDILKETHGVSATEAPQIQARLLRAAETAKIELSDAPYAQVTLDHLTRKNGSDIHLDVELSRETFENLICDDIERTLTSVSQALDDAGLVASDIDQILLVGGSTRIPMITTLLEARLGQLPRSEVDPDLCVALGAGIQAGREMGVETRAILIDITPYTFGISTLGDLNGDLYSHCFVPMIRRNTRLPAAKSDVFYTVYDKQKSVSLEVYQGENPDALENVHIGSYHFDMTPAPRNSPLLLTYDLDVNGILTLKAVEKSTGRSIEAVIENAFTGYDTAGLSASQERIQALMGDAEIIPLTASDPEPGKAEAMPEAIAAILKEAGEKLSRAPAEDRDEIVNCMEDIRTAVSEHRLSDANQLVETLEDILFYID